MIVTHEDLWWLLRRHPLLLPKANASEVKGTLDVSAYYERGSGRLFSSRHHTARSHDTFIADRFSIRIDFAPGSINKWPKVYEIGLRYPSIARRYDIPVDDLHFYSSGEACLGFDYPWDPPLTLEYFLTEIVEPFFYRLAYVDYYGLAAARADLWPEHSHSIAGLIEYQEDVRRGPSSLRSSRNRERHKQAPTSRTLHLQEETVRRLNHRLLTI